MSEFAECVHEAVDTLSGFARRRGKPSSNCYVPTLVLSKPVYAEQAACLTGLRCVYDPGNHRYVFRRGQFSDKEIGANLWRRL